MISDQENFTEDLFASQDQNQTFLSLSSSEKEEDEIPATQDEESQNIFQSPVKESQAEFTQSKVDSQREERLKYLNDKSIPITGGYFQGFIRKFCLNEPVTYMEKPPPRIVTEEEKKLIKIIEKSLIIPKEVDLTLYNPGQKFERPKDEMPQEVRDLCLKSKCGFVTAHQVFDVMSQVAQSQVDDDDVVIEKGAITQIENEYRQRSNSASSAKSAKTVADAVLMDFDDIDDATLTVIEEQQLLNNSLGNLSQKLSSSNKMAEIIESAMSQTVKQDLDVSMVDLMAYESDDEEMKFTEDLEMDFLNKTQYPDEELNTTMMEDEPCCSKSLKPEVFQGFSMASGKKLALSEATAKKIEAEFAFNDEMIQKNLKVAQETSDLSGFGFASGRGVKLKVPMTEKYQQEFLKEDQKIVAELKAGNEKPFKTPRAMSATPKLPGKFSSPAFRTPKSSLAPPSTSSGFIDSPVTPGTSKTPFKDQLPTSSGFISSPATPLTTAPLLSGFSMASGKNCKVDLEKIKRSAKIFDAEDKKVQQELEGEDFTTPGKPPFKKLRLDFGNSPVKSSPLLMECFKKGINQHSTPFVKKSRISSDSQEISDILQVCSVLDDTSVTLNEFPPASSKKKFGKLLDKFFDDDDDIFVDTQMIRQIDSIEMDVKNSLGMSETVKTSRKVALEKQRKEIEEKSESEKSKMAGSVFMKKSSRDRRSLKEFLCDSKPKETLRHDVTFSNAKNFKFVMANYETEEICKNNVDGIIVGDNSRLIFDETSRVGLEEIKISFLASPGVDPKLATDLWIENAIKMLVLKFAELENSFEKLQKFDLLSPENVLLQLKYRYDREIDRSHRSAIKKIVELDDVPYRRMVLKVVAVHEVPSVGYELELSDGWYSICASIDGGLADAIERGSIKSGTKLITSCAELRNCNGFDPLTMPSTVRLKISANSTRKVTDWSLKLGFCQDPTQIRVPLDSVLMNGGVIGKMQLVVTHIYQLLYVDSNGEKKEFRSEKLQNRVQNKSDINFFNLYERIVHQIQQEDSIERKKSIVELKKKSFKLAELSPEQIFDLIEYESDSDEISSIYKQLSVEMQRKLEQVKQERHQELKSKIDQKMGERNKISQLLKFRVVDALNPKTTGVVSLWSPSEEILSQIKVGKVIEVLNATAGPFNKEIQITAGKSSFVKILKSKIETEKFEKFFRAETKIEDVKENSQEEFDVACIVFRIEAAQSGKFQKVYVADEEMNFLCINFWNNLADYAYDDVLIEGRIVYAQNLQWRSMHAKEEIPQAFFNSDATTFTPSPKNETHRMRLEDFKHTISQITEFIIKCNDKFAQPNEFNVSVNKENQRANNTVNVFNRSPITPVIQTPVLSKTMPSDRFETTPTTGRKRLGMGNQMGFSKTTTPKIKPVKPLFAFTSTRSSARSSKSTIKKN